MVFLYYSFLPHSSQTAKINITSLASCYMFSQICPVAPPAQPSHPLQHQPCFAHLNSAQGFPPDSGRLFLLFPTIVKTLVCAVWEARCDSVQAHLVMTGGWLTRGCNGAERLLHSRLVGLRSSRVLLSKPQQTAYFTVL